MGGGTRRIGLALTLALPALLAVPARTFAAPAFTFSTPVQTQLPAGARVTDVADINGDGIADLVIVNRQADEVGVALGDGNGAFPTVLMSSVGARPDGAYAADFNQDGRPDLLLALETKATERQPNPLPEEIEVLLGNGLGAFALESPIALPGAGWPVLGDFNGDGHVDVVQAPTCSAGGDDGTLRTFLGDGQGGLAPGPRSEAPEGACSWQVGDFTGDGRADLATYTSDLTGHEPRVAGTGQEAIVVRPGEPSGGFGPAIITAPPAKGTFLTGPPVDLDGNHTLDLFEQAFVTPGEEYVLHGDGAGHFAASGPYADGAEGLGSLFLAGDFAADGSQSIVAFGTSIESMEPTAGGGLTARPLVALTGLGYGQWVADANRDGRPDLILVTEGKATVYLDQPVRPVLIDVRQSARRWREGHGLPHISRRVPAGTTFSFTLNVPAHVTFTFARRVEGIRRGGSCRRASRSGGGGPRCTIWLRAGRLGMEGNAGPNVVRIAGHLSLHVRLAPGPYSLSIVASGAGASSSPARLAFTVVP